MLSGISGQLIGEENKVEFGNWICGLMVIKFRAVSYKLFGSLKPDSGLVELLGHREVQVNVENADQQKETGVGDD